jgi:deoxyribodipyrimidine photolyase-related protein
MLILILPNQLYEKSELLKKINKDDTIILYEHPSYFSEFNFHKMKLVMHRATMKIYEKYLKKFCNNIIYIEYKNDLKKFYKHELVTYNPIDHNIFKNLKNNFNSVYFYENPGFICTQDELLEYNNLYNNFSHHTFYIWCRKKFNILIKDDKPIGNKWSFDKENRNPFPKNYKEKPLKPINNKYIQEAIIYINKNFKNHGNPEYYLPIDFKSAKNI